VELLRGGGSRYVDIKGFEAGGVRNALKKFVCISNICDVGIDVFQCREWHQGKNFARALQCRQGRVERQQVGKRRKMNETLVI
jgi:hypothetical protein